MVLFMEIGAKLKEAREEQGISLDGLQETTKIQKRYLVAIEEGNFKILPGKFYARAFIKEYATAVGLDPNELLAEYSADVPKTENADDEEVKYSRIQRTRKESTSEKSPAIYSLIPTIIVVLLIIGIIIAAVVLYNQTTSKSSSSQPQGEDNENEVIINNSKGDENSGKSEKERDEGDSNASEDEDDKDDKDPEGDQPQSKLELVEETGGKSEFDLMNAGDDVKLKLESSGSTWLEVNGDDESFYNALFNEDDSPLELDVSGKNEIYFSIGYAPDLTITINGEELEYAVDPKQQNVQKISINVKSGTQE
jgi:cytoskeletal protein RodZ